VIIKRIEPNGTLVIRFCCDPMIYSFIHQGFRLDEDEIKGFRIFTADSDVEVVACPFCGTKIEYGEEPDAEKRKNS